MATSPRAVPRTGTGQPLPVRKSRQGQEVTGGPSGQTPTGRKSAQGQQTVVDPGADGVERQWGRGGKTGGRRPNR
jgi:hypothetical protein